MIAFTTDVTELDVINVSGFFVGWPNPPTEAVFRDILLGSFKVILAVERGRLLGFITAISDGVLSAYIPLLEVLPEHQGQGIGRELMTRMRDALKDFYMIDLLCDPELVPFYESLGMRKATGAFDRNYARQSGKPSTVGSLS